MMRVANVPHLSIHVLQVAQPSVAHPQPVHVGFLHTLAHLEDAMPGKRLPAAANVVLPGETRLSEPVPGYLGCELVSFGKDDRVILTAYNAETGNAALVHVDQNDQEVIDRALADVVEHIEAGNPRARLTASLFGGVWSTSPGDIGVKIRDGLMDRGITPTWYQWSFPTGRDDQHGVVLDLSNGQATVFAHAAELADQFYASLSDDEVWSEFEGSDADGAYASLSDDAAWSDLDGSDDEGFVRTPRSG